MVLGKSALFMTDPVTNKSSPFLAKITYTLRSVYYICLYKNTYIHIYPIYYYNAVFIHLDEICANVVMPVIVQNI